MSTHTSVGPTPKTTSKPKRRRKLHKTIEAYLQHEGVSDAEQFCQDPGSPVEMLLRIVRQWPYDESGLLGLVAKNPALPMDKLLKLTGRWPVEVSTNPVFRMRMATEPGFLASLHYLVRRNLARGVGLEHRLLRELARARSVEKCVRRAAASNPSAPLDMLEDFCHRHAWQVRVALASNPQLPLSIQLRLAEDPRKEVRVALAYRRSVDPSALLVMGMAEDHVDVQIALIGNRLTPMQVFKRLEQVGNPRIRKLASVRQQHPKAFSRNFNTGRQFLENLYDPHST